VICPMCGGEMWTNHVGFAGSAFELWFWYCAVNLCGYWIPCDRKGNVPERIPVRGQDRPKEGIGG
jgi:hypothetical protein